MADVGSTHTVCQLLEQVRINIGSFTQSSQNPRVLGAFVIPISQVKKWKPREVK